MSASVGTTTRVRTQEAGQAAFSKAPSLLPHVRAIVELAGLSKAEVRFYQELSGELKVPVPKLLRAHHGMFGFEVVLEDLQASGCDMPTPGSALSPTQVSRVLQTLAVLHHQFWEDPRFRTCLGWLQRQRRREARLSKLSRPLLECGLLRAGALVPPAIRRGLRAYTNRRRSISEKLSRPPYTLTHHDCHPGNIFFTKEGEAGLLDWQLVRCGSWASDVAYLLATSLEPAERRHCSTDLVAAYLRANPRVPRAHADTVDAALGAHTAYALEAMILTMGLGPLMPKADMEALVVRTVAAVSDANAFGHLGLL